MGLFRTLRANEIDCRVSRATDKGLFLLLYKDARCDQNILDETVGAMNWQRSHTRDNANCIVSIWDADKKAWVSKEDTGTESNTEAEKGLASDSFKRACFNWGIGRELYTAPDIWINASDYSPISGKAGTYDKFRVSKIEYTDGVISQLEIINVKRKNAVVFSYGVGKATTEADENSVITEAELNTLKAIAKKKDKTFTKYRGTPIEELTYTKYRKALKELEAYPDVPDQK